MKTPIHAKNPGTAPNPGFVIILALVSGAAILSIIPDTIADTVPIPALVPDAILDTIPDTVADTVPIPAPVPTIVEGGVFIKVG